jgi:hypothetical protein
VRPPPASLQCSCWVGLLKSVFSDAAGRLHHSRQSSSGAGRRCRRTAQRWLQRPAELRPAVAWLQAWPTVLLSASKHAPRHRGPWLRHHHMKTCKGWPARCKPSLQRTRTDCSSASQTKNLPRLYCLAKEADTLCTHASPTLRSQPACAAATITALQVHAARSRAARRRRREGRRAAHTTHLRLSPW